MATVPLISSPDCGDPESGEPLRFVCGQRMLPVPDVASHRSPWRRAAITQRGACGRSLATTSQGRYLYWSSKSWASVRSDIPGTIEARLWQRTEGRIGKRLMPITRCMCSRC